MYKKLKSLLADDLVFTSLLLCCVAIVAFLLGRASVHEIVKTEPRTGPTVRQTALAPTAVLQSSSTTATSAATPQPSDSSETGPIVASKSGTKYHLTTCPGAKQIKTENKIYFATVAAAEASGYAPASNCRF